MQAFFVDDTSGITQLSPNAGGVDDTVKGLEL